ncbi:MAG: hypothetical protein IJ759_07875 [Bacteroidales bacterium]|nr:hypothetical protein [Bacteroidales bacterium]MBR1775422.1 hypothetical protein [Bacteroidales bacterium]
MEFNVGKRKIQDVKKYALWGKPAMIVTLDEFGNKTLVFGEGERTRAFVLYLIDNIQKEVKNVSKIEDCESYKILDNYLNLLFVQIELSSGQWCSEYFKHISMFIEEKINEAESQEVSDEENAEALSQARVLEQALKVVSNN